MAWAARTAKDGMPYRTLPKYFDLANQTVGERPNPVKQGACHNCILFQSSIVNKTKYLDTVSMTLKEAHTAAEVQVLIDSGSIGPTSG